MPLECVCASCGTPVAHCHFGLGKLYRQTSTREKTQEHFKTAIAMYREMNMQFWLEQVETALGPSRGSPP